MEKNWLTIFDYYGLELIVDKSDYEPVRIYGKRGDQISSAKIVFENGLFANILITDIALKTKLFEEDELLLCAVIESYLSEIIGAWLNVFVYDRIVETEVIKKKLQ